jgi:hypothetical protein
MTRPIGLALLLALAGAGCAPPGNLYAWNGYDNVLYRQARAPQDNEAYLEHLKQIIETTERAKDKVPPGIYAEYGYALFTNGQYDDAITYYQKERDAWPESRVFMEKMIRNTQQVKETQPSRQGPSAPLPEAPPATTEAGVRLEGGRA